MCHSVLRKLSKTLPPIRCNKHKDFNDNWFCGKKCLPKSHFFTLYHPYDKVVCPQCFKLFKSPIRYLIK